MFREEVEILDEAAATEIAGEALAAAARGTDAGADAEAEAEANARGRIGMEIE
jgi:hypothetical protein